MTGTMARYQLILAYDGTDFLGSQRQARHRTVQAELEGALQTLGWAGRSILMAGRTDSGVHASGQVAAFDFEWAHSPDELRAALNACLPRDMAVRHVREAPASFHPRFDATARRYRYRLFCDPVRDPNRERFAWRVWPGFDEAVLHEAASLFLGRHDFSAFGSPTRAKGGTLRTVALSAWKRYEDEWQFEVRADAFLYRMVRRLVFVQVAAAQGRLSVQSIADALGKPSKLLAGLAPAHGLTLVEVSYKDQSSK
jgi:tRNA pseudouridine38-40 synthase